MSSSNSCSGPQPSFWMAALASAELTTDAQKEKSSISILSTAVQLCGQESPWADPTLDHFFRSDGGGAEARGTYSLFRLMHMILGAPALPGDASNIGVSLWTTVLLMEHIDPEDKFSEAVLLATSEERSSMRLDLLGCLADPNKIDREVLGLAAGVIFLAEATLYPDTVRTGMSFMPP